MTTLGEFLFEGAVDDGWNVIVGGGGVIDTVQFYEGAQSYYLDCTGEAKGHRLGIGAMGSFRVITGRFYYRIKTDASGPASIMQIDNGIASLVLDCLDGRKLRPRFGATNGAESSVLNLDQWYRIDFMCRTDANPATFDWQIDGVAQTQLSVAQAADDQLTFRLGKIGGGTPANTYQCNFDSLRLTDQTADYPIGTKLARFLFGGM